MNRHNYVSEATGRWFYGDSISSKDSIYLFSTALRPVSGPIQPPIRWVPGLLSPLRQTCIYIITVSRYVILISKGAFSSLGCIASGGRTISEL